MHMDEFSIKQVHVYVLLECGIVHIKYRNAETKHTTQLQQSGFNLFSKVSLIWAV